MRRKLSPTTPRARGRPVADDGRDAREALLDAAVALFAERGVAATTAGEIAARAGVTPAMIHYYFRGREKLIDAVVDERLAQFIGFVFAAAPDAKAGVGAAVAALAARIFEAAKRMPWMPPIWIREIAAEGGQLRDRVIRHLPAAGIAAFAEKVVAAQRERLVAPGIEPRLVFVSLLGLTMFPLATQPVWRRLPGAEALTLDDLQRHAVALLSAALAPSPSRPRRKS
jgi:AcrR family transcriptional regulator